MAKDFKSSENLSKLLNLLQDVKDKELLDTTIDDLVTKTPRTSKTTGELFKTVGKATGESYGAGYKPNFVLSSGDEMLPAVIKGASGNQVVPVKNMAKDVVGEAVEVGARNLPTLAKNTLPSVGKQVAKNVAKGVGTAGLAAVGALLDETSTEAPGYNTPEIQQLIKETNLSKLPPEALANLENILAGQPQEVQKEVMSRMTPEQLASIQNTPPEAQNEADSLSKQISDATPQKVQEQLKKAPSAPKDPYAEIKAQLEALQKGSADELKSARSKDAILGFLNNLNKGLSRYDQAAASTGSRQAQQVMEALQVNPQFAAQAKEDQTSQYKALMDKLGIKKEEQQDLLTKEYRQAQMDEKEKDRQLQRDLASQKAMLDIQKEMLKAKEKGEITPGQEALDKAFAKEYADYVAGGGYAQAKGDIGRLEQVMKDIEKNKDMFTGPIDTLTESVGGFDAIRSITNPKLQDVKDRLEQIIQQDLRKTLGAQFTEKEGAQFLARSFNPKLSAEENLQRIKGFISDVKTRAEQKDKAAREFEQKGTLKDFKGDLNNKVEAQTQAESSGYSPVQEAGIKNVMDRNGVDRNTAINALKKAGKL